MSGVSLTIGISRSYGYISLALSCSVFFLCKNLMSTPRAMSASSLFMSSSAISAGVTSTSATSFSISANME
ncbi:hypothetical protein LOK49_LG03G00123 [Camellia lanceoleosa]|uniref:Uncharacterized protein n=1 Tax=Camellia lanceoleosa TaxID=1840588 RepID=A0ACC0IFS9_9ERIC|nr:hypothetical protein LOK49_LG03G00123 [Camellia lanceoleosa]